MYSDLTRDACTRPFIKKIQYKQHLLGFQVIQCSHVSSFRLKICQTQYRMTGQLVPYFYLTYWQASAIKNSFALLVCMSTCGQGWLSLLYRQEVTEKQKCMHSKVQDFVSFPRSKITLNEQNFQWCVNLKPFSTFVVLCCCCYCF